MLDMKVPGFGKIKIKNLILDYNGTLAQDGKILAEAYSILPDICQRLDVTVLTADTMGGCRDVLQDFDLDVEILTDKPEDVAKLNFLDRLGADQTMAVGNGANDKLMLEKALLGVAVIGPEACCTKTALAADLICPDIVKVFELIMHPLRVIASLRL